MKWGFQWKFVIAGAGVLLLFGVITLALWFLTHRLYYFPAVLSFCGLLLMIKGLIGEEGVW